MVIKIKGTDYNPASWSIDPETGMAKLSILSDSSIADLADALNGRTIEAFENEEQVGLWQNQGIESIVREGEIVAIAFKVTTLTQSIEAILRRDIDDSTEAILEIAEIVAEHDSRIEELEEFMESRVSIESRIDNMLNSLTDRVARLENGGN